jgi:hypothetical protein
MTWFLPRLHIPGGAAASLTHNVASIRPSAHLNTTRVIKASLDMLQLGGT